MFPPKIHKMCLKKPQKTITTKTKTKNKKQLLKPIPSLYSAVTSCKNLPKNSTTKTVKIILPSLYAAAALCKKFNAPICNTTQKAHFGFLFLQKPQYKIFSHKIILVNFKPSWCFNIKQTIRKASCTEFSKKMKNLILSPFWPKTFRKKFSHKTN